MLPRPDVSAMPPRNAAMTANVDRALALERWSEHSRWGQEIARQNAIRAAARASSDAADRPVDSATEDASEASRRTQRRRPASDHSRRSRKGRRAGSRR